MITRLPEANDMTDLLNDLVDKQAKNFSELNYQRIFKLCLASKILNSISGESDLRLLIDKERSDIEDICGLEWE